MNLESITHLIKGRDRFPLEAGLALQDQQMKLWALRLKPEVFALVQEEATMQNQTLPGDATGYDVWRGDAITQFVVAIDEIDLR